MTMAEYFFFSGSPSIFRFAQMADPPKRKKLVLGAKFATEVKTELAAEGAGVQRRQAEKTEPVASAAAVPVVAVVSAPPHSHALPPNAAPVLKKMTAPKKSKERLKREEKEKVEEEDRNGERLSEHDMSELVAERKEKAPPRELLPEGVPIVFQVGPEELRGPARVRRYRSGRMELEARGKVFEMRAAGEEGMGVVACLDWSNRRATVVGEVARRVVLVEKVV